jgi:CTP:molybdopterin cytidylyltransferase MocA
VNGSFRVAAIVLAAGASRRLGRAKQTVVIGGETLLERAVRIAREAGFVPVIVVVDAEGELAAELAAKLGKSGCEVVVNRQASEGMAASIRCGVERARALQVEGVVLMTCDQVALRAEHLRALSAEMDRVTGSSYAGKVGIPAYFPAAKFGELLELRGDMGARDLLRNAFGVGDEGLGLDIDTEEDLERARAFFGDDLRG